ncbi:GNAT family N-acetyltransferase [Frankia sp. CNm7]|uniref:GNAT family N-acetyltransferase n=1 Tax=Frankia nepalensis TaxID=1836974 RepID=A0A937UMW2_9ACTN|nr:GNAT family N-acetyltransferase [Frankia nepalensis]MBL7495233.1 GNAT family N-acetyltransferase [Frankia nepalensis]MBL7515423.1 GNAT family N-acetyltransferase [Frankia nepalensis]MBL7519070.1 GNAT family N-acetyltransferase [Frankia nepalensis]MBL7625635.1 GNAT family N-acetyltransferase [Frankia nepalensis]
MSALEPVEITAGALHLRPWRPDDADAAFEACQDPEIQRWTSVPSPYRRSDAVEFVSERAPLGWSTGTSATFAVVDATSGGLLASVGLQDLRDAAGLPGAGAGGDGEVGYWCAAPARGRGVTTDAVRVLCRWGFGALGLAVIRWQALVGNEPSLAVARGAGFRLDPEPRPLPHPRGGVADYWTGTLTP